jgi:hypothetical protein
MIKNNIIKYVAIGLGSLSYSYGFCRGWTLPIWKKNYNELPLRFILSCASGIIYISPYCLVKYTALLFRMRDVKYKKNHYGNHWNEWGIYHPRAI